MVDDLINISSSMNSESTASWLTGTADKDLSWMRHNIRRYRHRTSPLNPPDLTDDRGGVPSTRSKAWSALPETRQETVSAELKPFRLPGGLEILIARTGYRRSNWVCPAANRAARNLDCTGDWWYAPCNIAPDLPSR